MKIWFFDVTESPRTGGEVYNHRLYSRLRGQGIAVEAAFIEPVLGMARRRFRAVWTLTPARRLLVAWLFFWRFKGCQGILVVPHTYSREMFILNLWHHFIRRQPVVVILHHYDYYNSKSPFSPGKLFMQLKERAFFLSVEHVVTISDFCRRELLSVGVPEAKIAILHPGFEPQNIPSANTQSKPSADLLFVGTIYQRNGVDTLLEAMALLEDKAVRLHLAGNTAKGGAYLDELRRFVGEHRLQDRVFFHGRVDDPTLQKLYVEAGIFVFPARMVGFGIAFLEAMWAGLPIVATNVGATSELVEDEANGLLVPPDDPRALAAAIARLRAEPELRQRMGAEGRRRAAGYSWDEAEQGFERLLLELGAGPRQAAAAPAVAR